MVVTNPQLPPPSPHLHIPLITQALVVATLAPILFVFFPTAAAPFMAELVDSTVGRNRNHHWSINVLAVIGRQGVTYIGEGEKSLLECGDTNVTRCRVVVVVGRGVTIAIKGRVREE